MDQHKLRTLVFEKTGVKIDVDDPIFALVALNEAVLADTVERNVARLDEACANLADQATALAAGRAPARPVPASASPHLPDRRSMLAAGGAAVLGALLVLLGQALLFRPDPLPAPVVIAKELTGQQALALQRAEKLERIIAKLDVKTRNTIQAELQKP